MLYSVEHLIYDGGNCQYLDETTGKWRPARPVWVSWGRWKHAWWVLTGRCDAIWWPIDGNPYTDSNGEKHEG